MRLLCQKSITWNLEFKFPQIACKRVRTKSLPKTNSSFCHIFKHFTKFRVTKNKWVGWKIKDMFITFYQSSGRFSFTNREQISLSIYHCYNIGFMIWKHILHFLPFCISILLCCQPLELLPSCLQVVCAANDKFFSQAYLMRKSCNYSRLMSGSDLSISLYSYLEVHLMFDLTFDVHGPIIEK